jgi:hypothetical protein
MFGKVRGAVNYGRKKSYNIGPWIHHRYPLEQQEMILEIKKNLFYFFILKLE